jgi:hypothetical protein
LYFPVEVGHRPRSFTQVSAQKTGANLGYRAT